jgi:beta-lactam-binding protein with PASTA domain
VKIRVGPVAASVLLVAAGSCTSASTTHVPRTPSPPPSRVEVPKLKGLFEHQAVERLDRVGLLSRIVGHNDATAGPWQIVSQSKLPGTKIVEGSRVSFKVVAIRRVPDLTARVRVAPFPPTSSCSRSTL